MESSGVNIAAWLTCDLYQLVGNEVSMDGQNIPNDLPPIGLLEGSAVRFRMIVIATGAVA